jgi:hypothetical protein
MQDLRKLVRGALDRPAYHGRVPQQLGERVLIVIPEEIFPHYVIQFRGHALPFCGSRPNGRSQFF